MLMCSFNQGTRKYIARIIAKGRHDDDSSISKKLRFPELSGIALQRYTRAYGADTYESYKEEFNACSRLKERPSEMCDVEHRPHHDMESMIWILFDSLTRAQPKDAKDMCLTRLAVAVIEDFDTHVIESGKESRHEITRFDQVDWEKVLHPGLSFLAESLAHLSKFLRTDWSLWEDELEEDFMHEASKRILLREMVRIEEHNIDDKLSDTERSPPELPLLTAADEAGV